MEGGYLSHGCVVNESVSVNDRGPWKVETVYARVYDHDRARVYAHDRDRGHDHDHCYG